MKKIIILGIIIIGMLVCLTGCSSESEAETERRFIKVSDENSFNIYYDKETKVMYAISDSSYNYGTVTLLVNADGTPLLYGGE